MSKEKKSRIDQGTLSKFFKSIFDNFGISKAIANEVMKDPYVQKEMKQVRKSLDIIKNRVDEYDYINDPRTYD